MPTKTAVTGTTLFTKAFDRLNEQQKKAVEQIEGPVMVIAGPGTGKTEVVAMRVANILRTTHMRPHNVLCLTYSSSGAKAMRERLRQIIGPDAYGVTVQTVHSFCNDLILTHPHLFEDFRALEQISEIQRLRVIRRLMKALPTGSVLAKPNREHDRAAAVLSRISELKREGISTDALRALTPRFRHEIELTPTGRERSKNSQAYRSDLRLVQQYEEFIELYEGYRSALHEEHHYDYDDMVLTVIEVLKEHEWLLAQLQERYQYLLVDEFQDLNGAQNAVIELLTTPPLPELLPNVFTVGDDDQAIYRFQGASPKNMMSFLERFPSATLVTLTQNYRSTQLILDAASTLIAHNEERLVNKVKGVQKQLTAHNGQGNTPQLQRFPSGETERAGIAELLNEAHASGIPWHAMAVLCRRNSELIELEAVLSSAKLPVVITAKQDLLLHHAVRQAIVLMHAVEHPQNDVILSAAIGCETLNIHPADLGLLWVQYRKQHTAKSLREYILTSDQPSTVSFPLHLIESLHAQRTSSTLPDLLEKLLKKSGLLPKQEDRTADPRLITALQALYKYIKDRAYEQKDLTLQGLLLDLDQYLAEPSLRLEYNTPHLTEDGVNLMTAHAAKGLEFDLVIIPHLRLGNWGDRTKGSSLKLPDHLIFGLEKEQEQQAKQEDERRLLYVAITRAKQRCVLTFGETIRVREEIQDAQLSRFVAELGESIEEHRVSAEHVPTPIETLWRPPLNIDDAFAAFLRERLEQFELSVTALSAFLKDPQLFLWSHLLKMPQAKDARFSYGSAVHSALEQRNRAWQRGEPFAVDHLLKHFKEAMEHDELFSTRDREHYLHEGEHTLQEYAAQTQEIPLILSTEQTIKARYKDIPLTGKVDRIDLFHPQGQTCRVIDYKTGSIRRTEAAVRKDDYLIRQLIFYKLLTSLSPSFTHDATVFTLDFVGNLKEPRSVIDVEVTPQDVQELQKTIEIAWQRIHALNFTKHE